MNIFLIKIILAFVILIVALIGGIYPILAKATDKTQRFLSLGDLFARGIFLGAGLIHLLPDAQTGFNEVFPTHYPFVYVICAFAILGLYFIDQALTHISSKTNRFNWIPYLLVVILSIHSVIEGAALGVVNVFDTFIVIFIAIIAHKGSAAFALAINMRTQNLARNQMFKLILLFSLMTPMGVLFGSIISQILHGNLGRATEACFNAIAAGTFIYIAVFTKGAIDSTANTISAVKQVLLLGTGIALMALIAIWL